MTWIAIAKWINEQWVLYHPFLKIYNNFFTTKCLTGASYYSNSTQDKYLSFQVLYFYYISLLELLEAPLRCISAGLNGDISHVTNSSLEDSIWVDKNALATRLQVYFANQKISYTNIQSQVDQCHFCWYSGAWHHQGPFSVSCSE